MAQGTRHWSALSQVAGSWLYPMHGRALKWEPSQGYHMERDVRNWRYRRGRRKGDGKGGKTGESTGMGVGPS